MKTHNIRVLNPLRHHDSQKRRKSLWNICTLWYIVDIPPCQGEFTPKKVLDSADAQWSCGLPFLTAVDLLFGVWKTWCRKTRPQRSVGASAVLHLGGCAILRLRHCGGDLKERSGKWQLTNSASWLMTPQVAKHEVKSLRSARGERLGAAWQY